MSSRVELPSPRLKQKIIKNIIFSNCKNKWQNWHSPQECVKKKKNFQRALLLITHNETRQNQFYDRVITRISVSLSYSPIRSTALMSGVAVLWMCLRKDTRELGGQLSRIDYLYEHIIGLTRYSLINRFIRDDALKILLSSVHHSF